MRSAALAALLALPLAALGCSVEGSGSERLAVRAPAWVVPGRPLVVEVTTAGALAESRATLVVAVGNRVVGRESTAGGRARISIPADRLARGFNTISIKTGSERSVVEVRVVPIAYPLAGALLVVAFVATTLVWRRRAALSR